MKRIWNTMSTRKKVLFLTYTYVVDAYIVGMMLAGPKWPAVLVRALREHKSETVTFERWAKVTDRLEKEGIDWSEFEEESLDELCKQPDQVIDFFIQAWKNRDASDPEIPKEIREAWGQIVSDPRASH